jgi:hypothetical protein
VLAGGAKARIVRARRPAVRRCSRACSARRPARARPRDEALQVLRSSAGWSRCGCTARRQPAAEPRIRPASGALLRQAAGDIRTSRQEMMLALLGRMRRADAAPVMAAIAREPGDRSLRWQALRECLALDTTEGFAALGAIAEAGDDPLSRQAAALRAQLVETHPVLHTLEQQICPG